MEMEKTSINVNKKEVMKMRKTLITVVVALLSVILVYGNVNAITGQCSNCHTMHNSQNGSTVDASGPSQRLLNASCIACHKEDTTGGKTNSFGAPIVWHTTAPTGQGAAKTNAGGDFYWVVNTGDSYGHNVVGVKASDITITPADTPPGWDQTSTTGVTFDSKTLQVTGGEGWTSQLTCAGTFGCHGTRNAVDVGGIQGAHHNNLTGTATKADAVNTTTVGSSYRFLAGIYGLEDANWNWAELSTAHNEYYGANSASNRNYNAVSTTYTNKNTISFLCAECHGLFHSKIADDTAYAWRRHPSDIALPASGEYAKYNTADGAAIGTYNLEAPVARTTVPSDCTTCSTVTAGTDVVMCLSCHRAHGSNQPDLLRWDYSAMVAGGGTNGTGCFTCHTSKDDGS